MNEKIHRIIDLCLQLENEVTHCMFDMHTSCEMIKVYVWEGKELNDETLLYNDYAYYDGEMQDVKKITDIIRALEDLLQEQKSWEG